MIGDEDTNEDGIVTGTEKQWLPAQNSDLTIYPAPEDFKVDREQLYAPGRDSLKPHATNNLRYRATYLAIGAKRFVNNL